MGQDMFGDGPTGRDGETPVTTHAFSDILGRTTLPELHPVRVLLRDDAVADLEAAVTGALAPLARPGMLNAGASVAVAVGSRGIAGIDRIVRTTVSFFKSFGMHPFIVPAMGSHGGATAEGQAGILAHLGVTERDVGCPVRSSMEVVRIGSLPGGFPVYADRIASTAGHVFVINRVKPHTSFSGEHESGIVKMLTIGLGKQRGAEACHALGYGAFAETMPAMARVVLRTLPILGGLALVENAFDHTCLVRLAERDRFLETDAEMLRYARTRMPALPVPNLDVLLVRDMGKEISGTGVDPDVIGRSPSPSKRVAGSVTRVGTMRLTPGSGGNANGIGLSDAITKRLHDGIDYVATYTNVLTSTLLRNSFTPLVMPTDEALARCLVKTCNVPDPAAIRFVYIRDTLSVDRLWASAPVARELAGRSDVLIGGRPVRMTFDGNGDLTSPGWEEADFPA